MVRIGNLMYGLYPSKIYFEKTKGAPIKGIERPWKFYSKIISIKTANKGESLGYSSEYVAVKKMKIATIATGYGDGLTMEPTDKSIKLSSGFSHWGIIKVTKTISGGIKKSETGLSSKAFFIIAVHQGATIPPPVQCFNVGKE
jgi:hypothetical protein